MIYILDAQIDVHTMDYIKENISNINWHADSCVAEWICQFFTAIGC